MKTMPHSRRPLAEAILRPPRWCSRFSVPWLALSLNLSFFAPNAILADAPPFEWVRSMGGTGIDRGMAMVTDSMNNVYITGYFAGTATFGTTTLSGSGENFFLAKLSNHGDVVWARTVSSQSASAQGHGVAVDAAGAAYVVGSFRGTLTFGSTILTSSAFPWDAFIAKYSSAGTLVWATQAGSPVDADAKSAVVDSDGNIHVVGLFEWTASFGGTGLSSAGAEDAFHVKYDPAGNVIWARKAGGTGIDAGLGVAADSQGNTYLTGYFRSPVANFGGIALTNSVATEHPDIFVAKYDRDGNVVWARKAGSTSPGYSEEGRAVEADAAQNVYVAGCFGGTASF